MMVQKKNQKFLTCINETLGLVGGHHGNLFYPFVMDDVGFSIFD
jgi:hypothetical protein